MYCGINFIIISSFSRNSTINNTIYSIYVPRQIRPGIELVVNVQLIKSRNPINVSVLFESIDHRFSLNKSILVRNGKQKIALVLIIVCSFTDNFAMRRAPLLHSIGLGFISLMVTTKQSFSLTISYKDRVENQKFSKNLNNDS